MTNRLSGPFQQTFTLPVNVYPNVGKITLPLLHVKTFFSLHPIQNGRRRTLKTFAAVVTGLPRINAAIFLNATRGHGQTRLREGPVIVFQPPLHRASV